jgi:hypothetical protein
MDKKSWADIMDAEDLQVPVIITKHGVRVKTEVKKKDPVNIKDERKLRNVL